MQCSKAIWRRAEPQGWPWHSSTTATPASSSAASAALRARAPLLRSPAKLLSPWLGAEGLLRYPPGPRDCPRENDHRRPGREIFGRGKRQQGVIQIRFFADHPEKSCDSHIVAPRGTQYATGKRGWLESLSR